MKRASIWILALAVVFALCACAGPAQPHASAPATVPEGGFSAAMYEALEADWAAWRALSHEAQMLSSRMPGYCTREFEDWTAVEEFVGLELKNPLEPLETLEKGNWAAAPEGFNGAARFYVTFCGTEAGHVVWVQIDCGYRRDDTRICLNLSLYSDVPEGQTADKGWSVEHQRLFWLENSAYGAPVLTSDSGDGYTARQALLARGNVLYTLRVLAEPGEEDALSELLSALLKHFTSLPN